MSILSLLTNGHVDTSMEFEVLQEHFTSTVDIKEPYKEFYLNMLEDKGFEVTHEKDTIYTLTYETQKL